MTPETVSLVLPLPPSVLSPNRPVFSMRGRFAKAAAAKKLKRLAIEAVKEAQVDSGPWGLASVAATFYHKADNRRDPDNFMAMLKAAYDGLKEAGLIVDDDWRHLCREEPQFRIDKASPRVELVVTRRE